MSVQRWGKGLTPLTERLVCDLQTLSRSAVGTPKLAQEWPLLEKQISKCLSQFTARQVSISLGAIARAPIVPPRRLAFLLTEKLTALEKDLKLKDYAVVLNALARMGIKNELFLLQSLGPVVRKIRNSPTANIPAIVLVIDAYSRLGSFGDGQVFDAGIAVLGERQQELSGLDIVTLLRALARIPDIFVPRNFLLNLTGLLPKVEDVNLCVSGLVALSKHPRVDPESYRRLVDRVFLDLDSLTVHKKMQACSGLSVLEPAKAVKPLMQLVEFVIENPEQFKVECTNPQSGAIVLLAAVTRVHEKLNFEIVENFLRFSQTLIDSENVAGLSAVVNLYSCVNLGLTDELRDRISVALNEGKIRNPQTVSVLVNALAKLEEIELVMELIQSFGNRDEVRQVCRGMTEQGQLMTFLGTLQLVDISKFPGCEWWIESLVSCLAVSSTSPSESLSQLRIISSLANTGPRLVEFRPKFKELRIPSLGKGEARVSNFHKQVLESVSLVSERKSRVNFIDPSTGYEIDVLLAPSWLSYEASVVARYNKNSHSSKMKRVNTISNHISPGKEAELIAGPAKADHVHSNGWGYSDTSFSIDEEGMFSLSGNRYLYSGKNFPGFHDFIKKFGVDKDVKTEPGAFASCPPSVLNSAFVEALNASGISISFRDKERILASHGHTVQEIYALRFGALKRLVDAVVYPTSHLEVEKIVTLACRHNVVLIPYGGGTTVSHSLICDPSEKRMIVSVNVSKMNRILKIDSENLTATLEAGCVGSHLETSLNALGFTLGHEPDSWEFSTVGGWIATRASGMKKNMYGNIEDLLIDVKIVTPQGTLTRNTSGIPRLSSGPDVLQMVLGSEGTLGVITEAVLKIRPKSVVKEYASLVFPCFEKGLGFMREVARQRMQPASIRLMDNLQFQLGSSLKPEQSVWMNIVDKIIKFYVLNIKGFVADQLCAVTMTFEGDSKEGVVLHMKRLNDLASMFQGMPAGASNGIRGYFLTFVIAYLRDFGLRHQFIAESFETAVPWDRVAAVINETKKQVLEDCKQAGVQSEPMISARVTQTYDSGACIYFYLGMSWKGLSDPVGTYSRIEDRARECVMRHGGSISHHHGVGKIRKQFLKSQIGNVGELMIRSLKKAVDPGNIFATGNLV